MTPKILLLIILCTLTTFKVVQSAPMVFAISVDVAPRSVLVPVGRTSQSLGISLDCGDGGPAIQFGSAILDTTTGTYTFSCYYSTAGVKTITISCSGAYYPCLPSFGWNAGNPNAGWDQLPLISSFSSFGDLGTVDMHGAFYKLPNSIPLPALPTTVRDLSYAFAGSLFDHPIGFWTVSNVTSMNNMFDGASTFNQPLLAWKTDRIVTMAGMFRDAKTFNRPINGWNVSSVTNMASIFVGASLFNQDISAWDVRKVFSFSSAFKSTAFNQPIGAWTPSSCFDMSSMFESNQQFNQDISGWDVSRVTSMQSMFASSRFNRPINLWNTRSVATMASMFEANTVFNQPIGQWNVVNTANMARMFYGASSFNQSLANWNTSSATTMQFMFYNASSFGQNLRTWCVRLIPSSPAGFSDLSRLGVADLPQWGTCPTPAAPVASPVVAAPANSIPGPLASPVTVVPVPSSSPIQAPVAIACPPPQPPGNVSCVQGRWIVYTNSSSFFNGTSPPVVPVGVTIVITDTISVSNTTLVFPVSPNSGVILTSSCVDLSGSLKLQIPAGTTVYTGQQILIAQSTNPSCFNVGLTPVVETLNGAECDPVITASATTAQQTNLASLFVTLSLGERPARCNGIVLVPSVSADGISAGLIAGVTIAIVAVIAAIGGVLFYLKQRRYNLAVAEAQRKLNSGL